MQNALVVLTALMVSSALIGCSSKSSPTNAGNPPASSNQKANPNDEAHGALAWTLKIQSKCPAEVPNESCLGGNGFTVFADGRFQVGPTSEGAVKNGSITPDELNALASSINPELAATPLATEGHDTVAASDTSTEDTVTLARGSAEGDTIVHVVGTDLSFRTQTSDVGKTLLNSLKNLESKYYTLPFPDACSDGATALQTLFASMQTCTTDNECVYLDSTLETIDPNTHSFLTTDDCSVIKPLAVGNLKLVTTNKDKLLTSLGQTQQTCGQRLMRPECTEIVGFTLNSLPACKQGTCQAGQSSFLIR